MLPAIHESVKLFFHFLVAQSILLELRVQEAALILKLALAGFQVANEVFLGGLSFLVLVRVSLTLGVGFLVETLDDISLRR
jgi:hypothetical protein